MPKRRADATAGEDDEMRASEEKDNLPELPPADEEWSADEDDVEEEPDEEESGEDDEEGMEEGEPAVQEPSRVYLPGEAEEAEKTGDLVCDESAYQLYHTCGTLLPCLSFDVIPDNLGDERTTYPATVYCIAGSQAEKANKNSLLIMKMSKLSQMKPQKDSDDEDEDSGDDSDEDELPELECAQIRHIGAVNRLKFAKVNNVPLAASFSETGSVHLWDLTNAIRAVDDSRIMSNFRQNASDYTPFYTFSGHKTEGFALHWSRAAPGQLATGDCNGDIHVWKPISGGRWNVDQRSYRSHTSSVEDIQWSPNEANVFASCSSDKSIKIWDIRQNPISACMMTTGDAHTEDVNVIHWNPTEPFIVSGSDAGDIKVWDLRRFATGNAAVAVFRHHRGPICSIEWHPTDSTVFAAAGEDNQLTQWDIAVEKGEDEPQELDSVPPQLLFIHQGQTEIKELHWHPQMPGVILSSALNGIDVFKTISV